MTEVAKLTADTKVPYLSRQIVALVQTNRDTAYVFKVRMWGASSGVGTGVHQQIAMLFMGSGYREFEDRLAKQTAVFDSYKIDVYLTFKYGSCLEIQVHPTVGVMLLHGSTTNSPRCWSKKDRWMTNFRPDQLNKTRHGVSNGAVEPRQEVKQEGDLPWEVFLKIVKEVRPRSMAVLLVGTMKEVLGQAHTIGLTVGGKNPLHLQKDLEEKKIQIPADEKDIPTTYMQWVYSITNSANAPTDPDDFKEQFVKPLLDKPIPYLVRESPAPQAASDSSAPAPDTQIQATLAN